MSKKGYISGFSGAGKGTVVDRLVKQYGYSLSISATTRAPRVGEKDGESYFFKTQGKDVILEIETQGGTAGKRNFPRRFPDFYCASVRGGTLPPSGKEGDRTAWHSGKKACQGEGRVCLYGKI